jgi:hypothetical protein
MAARAHAVRYHKPEEPVLKFRRWDMQRRGGGDRIHRETYYLRQASLRRLIEGARTLNCPYDPDADVQVTLPHNHPTPFY